MGRGSLPIVFAIAICSTPARAQPGSTRTGTTSYAFDEGAESDDYMEPAPVQNRDDDEPRYRNPQGSINLSGFLGAYSSESETRFFFGMGFGYAALTGVMPGVRGLLETGNSGTGGDLVATLTLTPPLSISFTPFVVGEVGRRFTPGGPGWLYGAGGGVYFGDPGTSVAVQLGWVFRRVDFGDNVSRNAGGPIIGVSVAF